MNLYKENNLETYVSPDYAWDYESCIQQFLGDSFSGLAGRIREDKDFKKYFNLCIDKMTEEVLVLDTTTRHKEMLLNDLSRVKIELTKAQKIENHELIINMFWLVSRLFGFDYQSGTVKNKAFYHQDYASFLKEKVKELAKENLGMSAYEIKENGYKNIITKRKYLYKQLKSEKFSDQIIAQIFNTTEYQIKKLKNDL